MSDEPIAEADDERVEYAIQRTDGQFYRGMEFTTNQTEALLFTKKDAEHRAAKRSDWKVVRIPQRDYVRETLDIIRFVIVAMLPFIFVSRAQAQVLTVRVAALDGVSASIGGSKGPLAGNFANDGGGDVVTVDANGDVTCVSATAINGLFMNPPNVPTPTLSGPVILGVTALASGTLAAGKPDFILLASSTTSTLYELVSDGSCHFSIFAQYPTGNAPINTLVVSGSNVLAASNGNFGVIYSNDGSGNLTANQVAINSIGGIAGNLGTSLYTFAFQAVSGNTTFFTPTGTAGPSATFPGVLAGIFNGQIGPVVISFDTNAFHLTPLTWVNGNPVLGTVQTVPLTSNPVVFEIGNFGAGLPDGIAIINGGTVATFVNLAGNTWVENSVSSLNQFNHPNGISGNFVQDDAGYLVVLQTNSLAILTPQSQSLVWPANQNVTEIASLENIGNLAITTFAIAISNPDFTSPSNTCAGLAPGATCTVSFDYSNILAETGTATITSNANTVTVSLSAPALLPVISFVPASLNFGSVQVNRSGTTSVVISNSGAAPLTISGITVPSGAFQIGPGCVSTLPVNGSCSISVTFSPLALGLQSANISVVSNAPTSPDTISLQGTGIPEIAPLTILTNGTGSGTVTGGSANPLVGSIVTLTANPASGSLFTNWSGGCTGTNSVCSFTMPATPVSVTATFTAIIQQLQPSKTSLLFAPENLNVGSAAQVVTLTNGSSNVPITISNISVGAGFTQTNNCTTLPVGSSSCSINISFDPATSSQFSSTLVITSNAATISIPISGTTLTGPSAASVVVGQPATFSISTSGASPSFQWRKNGTNITGATAASYTTPTVPSDNGAIFTVAVTNAAGTTISAGAILSVLAITTQPANASVTLGQPATFNVIAQGASPLTYAWTKAGVSVGSNSPTYSTSATVAADNGAIVSVTVSNAAGQIISTNAILTVNFPSAITQQPTSQTVLLGQTAAFSVQATGTNLVYQWMKNNQNIGANSPTLSFVPAAADDQALIKVVVSDPFGPSVTSNTVTLTVNVPASITSQSPSVVAVGVNGTASFNIVAAGTAPITYQWSKNGVLIPGATSASYTTPALLGSDDLAIFSVAVTNPFGTATAQFQTDVILPPVITSQSIPPSVSVGQTASFGVNVRTNDGAASTFSWTKNGVLIPGATGPGYATGPTIASDNGAVFQVTVSDIGGSATASWTLLLVNLNPDFTIVLAPATQTIKAGTTATYILQAVLTNTTGPLSLSCQTNIPNGSCQLQSTSLAGSQQVNVTVTTPTTASIPWLYIWPIIGFLAALAFVTCPRTVRYRIPAFATLALLIVVSGCGAASGVQSTPPPPPPPSNNTYTVTVSGTLPGVVPKSATATLVVTH